MKKIKRQLLINSNISTVSFSANIPTIKMRQFVFRLTMLSVIAQSWALECWGRDYANDKDCLVSAKELRDNFFRVARVAFHLHRYIRISGPCH